jgi:hypothetical protein
MGQEDTAMKTLLKALLTALLSLVLTGPGAFAQERPAYTQEELDQMLAPIALYPDPLLSQILMAATYPVEVVQAARWSRANAHLRGEDAVRAVEPMDWDPSVKSLVAFPQILDRMDEQLDWTERLGDAFIAQELQVMDTIQYLRQQADAAGNLRPSPEMRIVREDGYIRIEPASPQLVYVPYYDPFVVYGSWWWPAHRPVHWAPWPGYYVRTTHATTFIWGGAVEIRTGFFFGSFNWPHRQVILVRPQPTKVIVNRQATVVHRTVVAPVGKPVRWQHDPRRGRGVPDRHTEARDSRPAQRVITGDARRQDGTGNPPRPESQRTTQPPARAVPAAPRSDTRPTGGALNGRERQAQTPRPAPAPATRSAQARRDAGRAYATARKDDAVAQPVARSLRAAPAAATHSASDRRDAERPAVTVRKDESVARPAARSLRATPAVDTRSASDRRDAGRPVVTMRKDESVARPVASRDSSALRVADSQPRAEMPRADVAARRAASAQTERASGRQ